MNRALRRISLGCLVMFVLLLINVNYLQGFQANSLAGEKGNIRSFDQAYQYQRGSISTADGVVVAKSRPVKGIYKFQRYYPHGPVYAPVTGYDSLYGSTGIEQAENKLLSGTDPTLTVRNLIDLITGKQKQGASVQLTINSKAQQAAYAGLKQNGKSGAVVALNPKTGAILALASYPSFNPNAYATFDGVKLNKVDARYRKDPAQPLLNRAINATYPPGSTFKIVTSSTAFGTGRYTREHRGVRAPLAVVLRLQQDAGQCQRRVLRERPRPAHLRLHPVVQHGLRSPRRPAGQPGAQAAGGQVRLQPLRPGHPDAGVAEQLPPGQPARRSPPTPRSASSTTR